VVVASYKVGTYKKMHNGTLKPQLLPTIIAAYVLALRREHYQRGVVERDWAGEWRERGKFLFLEVEDGFVTS
jgi:hypothetical protein